MESNSFRCSYCEINWRPLKTNIHCRRCGEETWLANGTTPISDEEAVLLAGEAAIRSNESMPSSPEAERQELLDAVIVEFRQWLDTVGPDDFRRSIKYPPGHPFA